MPTPAIPAPPPATINSLSRSRDSANPSAATGTVMLSMGIDRMGRSTIGVTDGGVTAPGFGVTSGRPGLVAGIGGCVGATGVPGRGATGPTTGAGVTVTPGWVAGVGPTGATGEGVGTTPRGFGVTGVGAGGDAWGAPVLTPPRGGIG